MAEETVTLTINGREATVPKGTLLVEAAKQAGIEIPAGGGTTNCPRVPS